MKPLPKDYYFQDTLRVAKDLIGKYLVRKYEDTYLIGRIVETEAYIGAIDKASHAYGNKRTDRTEPLYKIGGTVYIYFIYGMHYCMNVVTQKEGEAAGVLLRGVELVKGLEKASILRYNKPYHQLTKYQKKNISNGPGKLCQAMAIDISLKGTDVCSEDLFICDSINEITNPSLTILTSPRIGIDYAQEAVLFPWRFYVER